LAQKILWLKIYIISIPIVNLTLSKRCFPGRYETCMDDPFKADVMLRFMLKFLSKISRRKKNNLFFTIFSRNKMVYKSGGTLCEQTPRIEIGIKLRFGEVKK